MNTLSSAATYPSFGEKLFSKLLISFYFIFLCISGIKCNRSFSAAVLITAVVFIMLD
jgi:hypothetical protein